MPIQPMRRGGRSLRMDLDQETNKALLVKHIQESGGRGASMKEFEDVLPALSRRQIKVLIQELRNEGKIRSEGARRGAKWHPGTAGGFGQGR